MKGSQDFHKLFGLKTKIKYISDVFVEEKHQSNFLKKWKKFYNYRKDNLSPSRKKQIKNFINSFDEEKYKRSINKLITIKYISKDMGYGVFAKKNIPPYKILDHYAGLLRPDRAISDDNDSAFSFIKFLGYCIDGKKQGNWTRFMNHSDKTNVVVWEYFTSKGPRIFFSAGCHGIKKGKQLTYSYGDYYWEEEDELL